ncbi:hypothetical protein GOP47_0020455 [Adiantum capillus-veneris]|uniref:non-specific serine/threonine protein kinase n=1 Tax=Adiantum capillus-veneris TaxID=13818 RepID=A0A9D4U9F0_ADICA|nr:hypothetical protein GOP47_0020455 [Adiantum capillus-veneris]
MSPPLSSPIILASPPSSVTQTTSSPLPSHERHKPTLPTQLPHIPPTPAESPSATTTSHPPLSAPSNPIVNPEFPPVPRRASSPTKTQNSIMLSTPGIIGICISALVMLAFMASVTIFYCRKKRLHSKDDYVKGSKTKPFHHHGHSLSRKNSSDLIRMLPHPPPLTEFSSTHDVMHNVPRKRHNSLDDQIVVPRKAAIGSPGSPCWFTLEELTLACNNFSSANLLGEGGFGRVFKGILHNGLHVAIKQLKVGGSQGDREFQAEVETISRVHHKHLASLVGYCTAGKQRLLVYQFVPNQTLEYHLHCQNRQILNWPTRLKIALGAAQGLAYLHEDCQPRIIHRDIKASNILLDDDFNALVSDFGLAKLTSEARSHITTRVVGTFGYLAPEYASSGKLTEKSDVYSFGVLLLEIITGRKPIDNARPTMEESLVEWARTLLTLISTEDDLHLLADPLLGGAFEPREMFRMITAAAACVRHSSSKRPRMRKVVRALEGEYSLVDLNEGLKPGLSTLYESLERNRLSTTGDDRTSTDHRKEAMSSWAERVDIFKREEESREFSSGETSEYGLHPSASSSECHSSRELEPPDIPKLTAWIDTIDRV